MEAIHDPDSSCLPVMRKRNEKFIPVKINSAHTKTQERVSYLRDFRRTHEQLRVMTGNQGGLKGLGSENMLDVNMEEEVRLAYEGLKPVPVLDTSPGESGAAIEGAYHLRACLLIVSLAEGTEIWINGESTYNERVARVENQIISRLRDRLATARNAHEMFRIFSKFNSLFVRPKVSPDNVSIDFVIQCNNSAFIFSYIRFEVLSRNTRLDSLIRSRKISRSCIRNSQAITATRRLSTCLNCVTYLQSPARSFGPSKSRSSFQPI